MAALSPRCDYIFQLTPSIEKTYTIGKQLGQPGQFGVAKLCTHKSTGSVRAVKIISKGRFTQSKQKVIYFDGLRSEVETMKKLSEKSTSNIIKFYEYFEDLNDLYLVMELCTGGELFDRIQERGTYSEKDAQEVLLQMVQAVNALHECSIAHCDIKPDNFLFSSADARATLKMIDFGHSHKVGNREYLKMLVGTPYYVAPEVLRGKYNIACDMWSVGVVCFVMLFGYPPFYADQDVYGQMTDEKIFQLVKKGFSPETKSGYGPWFPSSISVSDSAKDLIGKLLRKDVADRLTAQEALEHPWLRGDTAARSPLDNSVLSAIKNFSASCKFKQAVLQHMATNLSDDSVQHLKEMFKKLDANGDGTVTIDELSDAIESLDAREAGSTRELMKSLDINGDGVISYEEWLMFIVQRRLDAKEERLYQAFRQFDLNGDGHITAAELQQVLSNNSNNEIAKLIMEVDKDGDGTVDYEEFLAMWHDKQIDQNGLKLPDGDDE